MDLWPDNLYSLFLMWCFYITWIAFISAGNISFGVKNLYIKLLRFIFERCGEEMNLRESYLWKTCDESLKCTNMINREYPVKNGIISVKRDGYKSDIENKIVFQDVLYFVKSGIESIIQDSLTNSLENEKLKYWNLLTRKKEQPQFVSATMNFLWFLGGLYRYFVLISIKIPLFLLSLFLATIIYPCIGYFLPNTQIRKKVYGIVTLFLFRIYLQSFTSVVHYHNTQFRAKPGGICVANHTSVMDIFILGADNTYAMVGQKQAGLIKHVQNLFSKAESHVWFERTSSNDRNSVLNILRSHIQDGSKLPVLLFPEGVCTNNTSVLRFKKGCFDLGATIYPVVIKYDQMFSSVYWSQDDFMSHLFDLMSSWALVCHVWYLPPEKMGEDESALDFANRIKSRIVDTGGFQNICWDGMLKYHKPDVTLLEQNKTNYGNILIFEE